MALALWRATAYVAALAVPIEAIHLSEKYHRVATAGGYDFSGITTALSLITAGTALAIFLPLSILFKGPAWAFTCFVAGAFIPLTFSFHELGWIGGAVAGLGGGMVAALVLDPRLVAARRVIRFLSAMLRGHPLGQREYTGFRAVLDDNADKRKSRRRRDNEPGE